MTAFHESSTERFVAGVYQQKVTGRTEALACTCPLAGYGSERRQDAESEADMQ
jgi:hypothetical protein